MQAVHENCGAIISTMLAISASNNGMVNILISNDDGIDFAGLIALKKVLAAKANVYAVAPDKERSATSMALTIFDDITVEKVADDAFVIGGFPVDCVNIALYAGIIDKKIDLVVSGINKGVNLGDDVHYSGTVGAARHAYIHHIAGIAFSCGHLNFTDNFDEVAQFASDFIFDNLSLLAKPILLNVNYPTEKDFQGIKWTKLGSRIYRDSYKKSAISDNLFVVNLGGSELSFEEKDDTDFTWYNRGYATVTPLTLDATDYQQLERHRDHTTK